LLGGDGQQENIDYFQAPAGPGAPIGGANTTFIHLRNDSMTTKKYFNLAYDRKLVPAGWKVQVNGGHLGMELLPNEVRDIPVVVTPTSTMPAGSVGRIKIFASNFHLLVSDKDPNDKHPEFKQLGGVTVEGHAVLKTHIKCEATRQGSAVIFRGRLELPKGAKFDMRKMTVMLAGAVPGKRKGEFKFLPRQTGHAPLTGDGEFKGIVERAEFKYGTCMFAGTDTLSSAIADFALVK